jgi:DNA-binding NarL/FixJ family response regulator
MRAAFENAHFFSASKNCHRCGLEFNADPKMRVCCSCKKPRGESRIASRHLSLRENQIVDLICEGLLNKQIAFQLHLREGTIKTYLNIIFQKVGVSNRTELAVWALTRRESAA